MDRSLLGKKVYVIMGIGVNSGTKQVGTVVSHDGYDFWVAFRKGIVGDYCYIDDETFSDAYYIKVENLEDYYGYEYENFDEEELTLVERYYPNTEIFKKLYPTHEVVGNMIKVEA